MSTKKEKEHSKFLAKTYKQWKHNLKHEKLEMLGGMTVEEYNKMERKQFMSYKKPKNETNNNLQKKL